MPNTHSTLTSLFTDIANAIRAKKGTSADIVADNFPIEIASIHSGGAGGNYNIESVDDGNGGQILNITDAQGGTEITDGIVVKSRNANGYATSVEKYGIIGPYEFHYASGSNRYQFLDTVELKNGAVSAGQNAFQNSAITSIVGIENLTTLGLNTFYGSHIQVFNFASLTQITGDSSFRNSTATEIVMPLIANAKNNTFQSCTSLQRVELGSVGHTLTNVGGSTFLGCTQSNLTITVYTNGTYADTALANIRNGATNATIIIKASENTTYGGTSYAAGETMITSEVA